MEGWEEIQASLAQMLASQQSLVSRLEALEQSGLSASLQIPSVSEAEANARIAEAEAVVKVAKVEAEAQVALAKVYEDGATERAELQTEAEQKLVETTAEVAPESLEVTVLADNPGSQLPETNSNRKASILERLLLGR